MDPNVLLQDTARTSLFTFELRLDRGSSTLRRLQLTAGTNITVLDHTSPASYSNGPFKFFSDGISADCGTRRIERLARSTLSFTIDDFSGFLFATQTFNGREHHRGGRHSGDQLRGSNLHRPRWIDGRPHADTVHRTRRNTDPRRGLAVRWWTWLSCDVRWTTQAEAEVRLGSNAKRITRATRSS